MLTGSMSGSVFHYSSKLTWLNRHCAPSPQPLNEPAGFGRYRQRLELVRPDTEALRFLAKCRRRLNCVKLALDWLLQNKAMLHAAGSIIKGHLIKRHHREEHGVTCLGDMLYLGRPTDKIRPAAYGDQACRHTGHPHCFHIEFRLKGMQTLNRAGIYSVTDLLNFDHRAFWERRLLLAELDYGYFGRMLATRHDGAGRRRKCTDEDRVTGLRLFQWVGNGSTQKIVDIYRKQIPLIARCLRFVSVSHLLPLMGRHLITIRHHNFTLPHLTRNDGHRRGLRRRYGHMPERIPQLKQSEYTSSISTDLRAFYRHRLLNDLHFRIEQYTKDNNNKDNNNDGHDDDIADD